MIAFAKKASMPSSAPAHVRLLAFEFKTFASGCLIAAPKCWILFRVLDLEDLLLSCVPSKLSSENVLPPLSRKSDPVRSAPLDGSNSLLRTPACSHKSDFE